MDIKYLIRFINRLKQEGNCWVWIGGNNGKGYGQLSVHGKTHYVHRLSYEIFIGMIPEGLEIDHLCKNRSCVRPDHLEAVNHRENLMRGETVSAINRRKTKCPRGHEYTKRKSRNSRDCYTCKNEHRRLLNKQ